MSYIKIVAAAALLLSVSGCVRIETSTRPSPSVPTVTTSPGTCTEPGGISLTIEREVSQSYCIRGFAGTSWQLLEEVAQIRGTDDYPDSFVCRIDEWPKDSDNDCSSSASNFGYWNFYTSESGEWQVANEGAASHRPNCGSAEAWKWIAGAWSEQVAMPSSDPEVFSCPD